jgi:outer membrane beta-barrel protein
MRKQDYVLQRLALHVLMTALGLVALIAPAVATAQAQQPANEQVIVPEVDRRKVRVPRIPSNDIEVGAFIGTYATQNFGSSTVYGGRLGYHVTEDIFVEGVYAQTKVSDENFRQILPGGIFAQPEENLTYYNLSAGYNVLPGEVFIWKNYARASALYLIGGIGSTSFIKQRRQTFNFGVGLRVFLADWAALQVDMRQHIFSLDLLGKRQNTRNNELSAGLTFFF